MKKFTLLCATAASMMMAGTANAAATANATLNLNASVPNTCYIIALTEIATTGSGTSDSTTNNASVNINFGTNLVNTTTALRDGGGSLYNLAGYCNYANHSIGIKSDNGGMTLSGPAPSVSGTFERRIPYTASFSGWGSAPTVNITASGPLTTATADPDVDNDTSSSAVLSILSPITIVVPGSGVAPLLAGTYTDVLRVRIGGTL